MGGGVLEDSWLQSQEPMLGGSNRQTEAGLEGSHFLSVHDVSFHPLCPSLSVPVSSGPQGKSRLTRHSKATTARVCHAELCLGCSCRSAGHKWGGPPGEVVEVLQS